MGTWRIWGPALFSGTTTWLVARLAGDWARRRHILDVPNQRSSHAHPTPRLGGAGIVAAVVATLLWFGAGVDGDGVRLTGLLLIGLALAAVGFVDDLRGLPAHFRLVLQTLAAVATVACVPSLARAHVAVAEPAAGLIGSIIVVFWIVAFVNAFNFMDGIDGIAGVQALVAGVAWAAIGASLADDTLRFTGTVVAGSAFGFLLLNWSPARIFMGDGGSAFLGYALAVLPLLARDPARVALPAVFIVWPFLFDTAFTLVRRAARGEHLMQAHRSHLYQRLTGRGRSHAAVASIYALLSAVGAVAAWWAAVVEPRPRGWALGTAVVAVLAAWLWALVDRSERRAATSR